MYFFKDEQVETSAELVVIRREETAFILVVLMVTHKWEKNIYHQKKDLLFHLQKYHKKHVGRLYKYTNQKLIRTFSLKLSEGDFWLACLVLHFRAT